MTTPSSRVRAQTPAEPSATVERAGEPPSVPPAHAEVVVGILDDRGAVPLVHAALAEATARHASIRVVRVLPLGAAQHEVLSADSLAYAVTRAAGEDGVTVPSRFEVAVGDPVEVLLERTRDATLLVVGTDRDGSTVAQRCRADAQCSVLVVGGPPPA